MVLPEVQKPQRYVALDGLRGITAIAVVWLHLDLYHIYPFKSPNHAVDLFFIMSGFVIASVYEKRLPELGFGEFMKRRLLRLYPTYGLSLAIAILFLLFLYTISHGRESIATGLISFPFQALYLPTPPALVPVHRSFYMLNGPAWSLFWELLINAAYAAGLMLLTTRVLIAIVACAAAWLIILLLQGIPIYTGSDWQTWYVGAARVLYGFPLGVLIYRGRAPRFDTPFWVLALLCAATLFLPSFVSIFMILPAVVWLAIGSSAKHPMLEWLGLISYPLYAIHTPLNFVFDWFIHHLWKSIDPRVLGFSALFAYCGVAWLVAVRWDRPAREWLERRFANRKIAATRLADM